MIGWSIFASVYGLEEGDFLRFKYNGDSHLKVEIYDPTDCEKELSCVAMNHYPGLQKWSIPRNKPMLFSDYEKLATGHDDLDIDSCKTLKINPSGSSPHCDQISLLTTFIIDFCTAEKETLSSDGIQDSMNSGEVQTSTRSQLFLSDRLQND